MCIELNLESVVLFIRHYSCILNSTTYENCKYRRKIELYKIISESCVEEASSSASEIDVRNFDVWMDKYTHKHTSYTRLIVL